MPKFVDRVAEQATTARPMVAFLTLLAAPFYVLGWLLGLVVVGALTIYGAVKLGIKDARKRAEPVAASPGDGV